MSVWATGAETNAPYAAILKALPDTCARARTCTRNGASLATRGGGVPAKCDARISWKNCSRAVVARRSRTRASEVGRQG